MSRRESGIGRCPHRRTACAHVLRLEILQGPGRRTAESEHSEWGETRQEVKQEREKLDAFYLSKVQPMREAKHGNDMRWWKIIRNHTGCSVRNRVEEEMWLSWLKQRFRGEMVAAERGGKWMYQLININIHQISSNLLFPYHLAWFML